MDFEALIAKLRNPGEDPVPETIYDDLSQAYSSVLSGAAEKEAAHENALKEREAEISRLKAQNFDLLMSAPAQQVSTETQDQASDDDEPSGIDSLFEN